NKLREEMLSLVLIVGVKDDALSSQLQMDNSVTLQKIIDSARQKEMVRSQQKVLRSESAALKTAPSSAQLGSDTTVDAINRHSHHEGKWRPSRQQNFSNESTNKC